MKNGEYTVTDVVMYSALSASSIVAGIASTISAVANPNFSSILMTGAAYLFCLLSTGMMKRSIAEVKENKKLTKKIDSNYACA